MFYIDTLQIDETALKLGLGTRNANIEENTRVSFFVVVVADTGDMKAYTTISRSKMLQFIKLCISHKEQYYVYRKPI